MKPLRLTVEGFTSLRERVELDFSGLDLFAITGPTGAGKSSLIDAIVFALYGQVPRVGDDYRQLISQGAERLSVLFEFAVGTDRYRVARAARPDRPSQQRLERLLPDGSHPIADKSREIRAEVERLLGLDYDGFTRAVVLPQGQFDAFLKGEPKERRKILVALLSLGVYERMQQLANQKVAGARNEAEFIRKQVESDFDGATAEALADARAALHAAEAAAGGAEAQLERLAEAAEGAQTARAARREHLALGREAEAEAQTLASAQAALDDAEAKAAGLAVELDASGQELAAAGFDEARHALLVAAQPRADQLVALQPRVSKLVAELAANRKAIDSAQTALADAEAGLPLVERQERQSREQEASARAARDAAHREHLAVALRRGLAPGQPCPVCTQTVALVPALEEPALEAAEARVREAEAARQAAADRLQSHRLALAQRRAALEGLGRERARTEEQLRDTRALAGEAGSALQQAGFLEIEIADPDGLASRVQSELEKAESARRGRLALQNKRQSIAQRQAQLASVLAAESVRRDAARGRLADLAAKTRHASLRLEDARRELLALAAAASWPGLDLLPSGRDEADVIESLRASAQRGAADAAARLASARHSVERIEQALARVGELRSRRAQLEAEAVLHKALADHLRADELVAWIQEEALQRLAAEGSRHLATLSQGRYELRLGTGDDEPAARAEQDFFVVDHWNGANARSVRTLSGGETFLASLALALALAESLVELSAEGRAAQALESLFLDEGFGALDAETLDVVVSALDALHGGQRTVGIVTHVRELAERLPARIEVRRVGNASTVAVV